MCQTDWVGIGEMSSEWIYVQIYEWVWASLGMYGKVGQTWMGNISSRWVWVCLQVGVGEFGHILALVGRSR